MSLELTVLTCEAGRTSGYLLRHEGRHVLVDCGPGVIDAVGRVIALDDLDAVVVTHSHADHSLDLMALGYALRFPVRRTRPLPLYLPADMRGAIDALDAVFGVPKVLAAPITEGMDVHPLDLADPRPIEVVEDVTLVVRPARHAVPSAALRFTAAGTTIAFSSDTGPTPTVTETAADADLFVCEATYLEAAPVELADHGHLTTAEAARTAAEAGARHLILTHLFRAADGPEARGRAAEHYDGPIDVAVRGGRWPIGT